MFHRSSTWKPNTHIHSHTLAGTQYAVVECQETDATTYRQETVIVFWTEQMCIFRPVKSETRAGYAVFIFSVRTGLLNQWFAESHAVTRCSKFSPAHRCGCENLILSPVLFWHLCTEHNRQKSFQCPSEPSRKFLSLCWHPPTGCLIFTTNQKQQSKSLWQWYCERNVFLQDYLYVVWIIPVYQCGWFEVRDQLLEYKWCLVNTEDPQCTKRRTWLSSMLVIWLWFAIRHLIQIKYPDLFITWDRILVTEVI